MKQIYFKKIAFFLFIAPTLFYAQTQQQMLELKKKTNIKYLVELQKTLGVKSKLERDRAYQLADQKGWKKTFTDANGSTLELIKVSEEGKPIYYKTDNIFDASPIPNVVAARATRASWLHDGGGLGLNVEGQGMTVHVWDGGLARTTHQEYDGAGGANRVRQGQAGNLNFHAAHVMGIIVSSGVQPAAKATAPQAKGVAFDWNSDDAEIAQEASNGMIISNHSYGFRAVDIPDAWFGAYRNDARIQDDIMFNAPYYLQVISAGNDGNENTANGDPLDNEPGYDKLSGMKTSKNSMVVANGRDPQIGSEGELLSIVRNSSSSEGPTDDYRIKPDITGNGTGVFSTLETSDTAYGSLTGTSMSAPNVAGSMLLLQQHYMNTNGKLMKAATLKGLTLHTADDVGSVGPDTFFGWGLMNSKRAAEAISNEGLKSMIVEKTINDGETLTFTVKSDGESPLLASISWTDAPGTIKTLSNDTTPVLVNDLDIRVSQNTDTFEPWKLNSVNTNGKGDNIVDPYERVDIENASGEYTITVSFKGNLQGGKQDFSLIVTGISNDFTFTSSNSIQEICSDEGSAVFNFDYKQSLNTNTALTFENLPANATGTFSSNSISQDGAFTLTVDNLENVTPGTYSVDVVGNNGSEEKRRTLELTVVTPVEITESTTLSAPSNQFKGANNTVNLTWDQNTQALEYYIEVSESPSFNNLVASTKQSELTYEVTGLASNRVYYWRVRPENKCRQGEFSETFSFQTVVNDCSNTYTATDFTNADISDTNPIEVSYVPIEIPDDISVSRIIVNTNIEHTNVSELRLYIQSPAAPGNQVDLLDSKCSGGVNINATFDDSGNALDCSQGTPAVTGTLLPEESLSTNFSGQSAMGTWFVVTRDGTVGNGGNIISASISICTSVENTNVPSLTNNGIDVVANGSYVFKTADLEATSSSETAVDQVYTVVGLPTKGTIQKNGADLGIGGTFTQDDVNNGLIRFTNTQTELFSDSFKVDVTNAANGWLPNQTINLTATTLSNELLEIDGLSVYPNPTLGDINIKLNRKSDTDVQITLFDLQGRRVLNRTFKNSPINFNEQVSVRSLSNGVYLLNIREGSYSSTRRIIISK